MRLKFNMKKRLLSIWGILALFLFVKNVFAFDLTLTGVGTQSTIGTNYSLINYFGGIPTLIGTASPSAQIGVYLNALLNYTTASTSGVWQFTPASLNQGDNPIVISSGTQNISFNLRFNATVSGSMATPAALPAETTLPSSGVWEYYIPAIGIGLGVYFLGRFGKKRMQKWNDGD